jgi:hypothetical protein
MITLTTSTFYKKIILQNRQNNHVQLSPLSITVHIYQLKYNVELYIHIY